MSAEIIAQLRDSCDDSALLFIKNYVSNLNQLLHKLTINADDEENYLTCFEEVVKSITTLRNLCHTRRSFQGFIVESEYFEEFFTLAWEIEHRMTTKLTMEQIGRIKTVMWQLASNLCIVNLNAKDIFWQKCNKILLFSLNNEISLVTDIQLCILYNIKETPDQSYLQPMQIFELVIKVWSNYLEKKMDFDIPFLHIFFEDYLVSTHIEVLPLYNQLEPENRILVLKYISTYIRTGSPNDSIKKDFMEYLSNEFKRKSDCILKTDPSHLNQIYPKEIIALLDVIAIATGAELYTNTYFNDNALFLNVGCLLKAVNDIGRKSNNIFTPMEKLIEVAPNSNINPNYQNEISYQLKSQLIRILANLLYKNCKNQQYVREMNIITAILDCTRIDARNPLLKEWSILAIRNFCDNCHENQELVTQLSKVNDVKYDIENDLNMEMGSLRIRPDA